MALLATNITATVISRKDGATQATLTTGIFSGEGWLQVSKAPVVAEWPPNPGNSDLLAQMTEFDLWLGSEDVSGQVYKPQIGDVMRVTSLEGDTTIEGDYAVAANPQPHAGSASLGLSYTSLPCVRLKTP